QLGQAEGLGSRPLNGKGGLDCGCGAGLLAEPLARLGAKVTAVDAAPELIEVAKAHAAGQGLAIDYCAVGVEALDRQFDLVTSMEVIEHVADPQSFVNDLAARLAPGGLMILSTPNKTAWSKLLTITLAEGFGRIPKGTHDFDKFIDPDMMRGLLAQAGLECIDFEGIAITPTRGLPLSEDTSLNYLVAAKHAGEAMASFYVLGHGSLEWPSDQLDDVEAFTPAGFYCHRYVLASGYEDAANKAFRRIRKSLEKQTGWLKLGLAKLTLEASELKP